MKLYRIGAHGALWPSEAIDVLGHSRARRYARVVNQHPDWATEPMPSGVPFQLVPRKEMDR